MTPRLSSSVPVPTSNGSKPRPHARSSARSLDADATSSADGTPCPVAEAAAAAATGRRKSVSFDLAHNSERTLPRDSGKCWKRLEKQIADLGLTTPATRAFADYYVCERHGHPEVVVKSPPKEVAVKYMMSAAAARAHADSSRTRALVARQDSGIVDSCQVYSLASVSGSRPVVGRGYHHPPAYATEDQDSDLDVDEVLPPIDEDSDQHDDIFAMDADVDDDASSTDSGYPPSTAMPVPAVEPEPEVIDQTIRTLALSKTPDHPILHLPEDHNMFVDRKAVHQMVQATEALARDLDDIEFGKKERKNKKKQTVAAIAPEPTTSDLAPCQGGGKKAAGKGKRGGKHGGKKHH